MRFFLLFAALSTIASAAPVSTNPLEEFSGLMFKRDVLGNLTRTELKEAKELRNRLREIRKAIREKLEEEHPEIVLPDRIAKKIAHLPVADSSLVSVPAKNALAGVAEDLFQGDMFLSRSQLDAIDPTISKKKKRQAMGDEQAMTRLWNTFYYSFDSLLPQKHTKLARKAIEIWRNNTCINFVESNTAANRVNFVYENGCWSSLGNARIGVQKLSLGQGCDELGIAIHEIGHALGFIHGQSRYDRDDYIKIQPQYGVAGYEEQITFKATEKNNNNFGHPYEYASVMHYSASGTGGLTMVAKQAQYQNTMGSLMISFIDISVMNELYSCKDACGPPMSLCQNGGFPHPRKCGECLCPTGFAGELCTERPNDGCGATLVATNTTKVLSGRSGGNVAFSDDFQKCHWLIKAAPGSKKIRVKITSLPERYCQIGCQYIGLEVKFNKDQRRAGSRHCCPKDVGKVFTSDANVMPIIAYNRYIWEKFSIEYQAI